MRKFILLGFILSALLPAFAQKMGTLTGQIKDAPGAVITDAVVIVHSDGALVWGNTKKVGAKYQDFRISPDPSSGKYNMKLPAGYYYDVLVSRANFRPQCAKVYISDSEPTEFNVTLQVDTREGIGRPPR